MADNVIGIKFGVAGGSSLSGESGNLIKEQLEAIAKSISPLSVTVKLDNSELKNSLNALQDVKQKLENALKTGNASGSGGNTRVKAVNEEAQALNKLRSQLNAVTKLYNRVHSTKDTQSGKRAELATQLEEAQAVYDKLKSDTQANAPDVWSAISGQVGELDETYAKLQRVTEAGERDAELTKQRTAKYKELKAALDEYKKAAIDAVKAVPGSTESDKLNKRKEAAKKAYDTLRAETETKSPDIWSGIAQEVDNYEESVKRAIKRQQQFNNIANDKKMSTSMQTSFKGMQANAEALAERYSDLTKHNKEAAKAMDELLKKARADYRGQDNWVDDNGEKHEKADYGEAVKQNRELAQAIKETSAKMSKMEVESDTLGKKLRETFSSKIIQTFSYAIIALATNALRQVYVNVVELDAAVTNLQIATGKTREETKELITTYAQLAKQLGTTVTEATDAADTWLRQGYDVADTNTLISNTLKLAKLGQLDSAEAATALTSAMKGYKVEVEDALGIVDKLTAVDMDAAVSAGDIATAMAETAASASLAGVSMDTLIGYIATVAEVTQDGAESVGTFYKTLFARMGNVKAGVEVDEETGESLNDVERVLNRVGISLRDSEGEFRDFSTVLDEVSAKWDNYTSVQQHQIATAFAGTRQQEKFIVLMENYASAMEYAATATDSAGTATEKYNAAYMDSIEAKLDTLTATWQEFSTTILDSELIKFGVDFLSGLAEALTAIVGFSDSVVGKAVIIMAAATALVTLYNSKIKPLFYTDDISGFLNNIMSLGDQLKTQLKNLGQSLLQSAPILIITTLITLLNEFGDKAPSTALIVIGALTAVGAAVVLMFKIINTETMAFMASNPLGWILALITAIVTGIIAVVKGISAAVNSSTKAMEDAIAKAKESKETWEDTCDEIEDVNDELTEATDRLTELQKLSAAGKITLVEQEELDKLTDTVNKLKEEKQLLEDRAADEKVEAQKDAADAVQKILDEKLSDAYVQEDDWWLNSIGRVAASIFSAGISDAFGYGISDWTIKHTSASDYVKQILGDWENATEQQKQYASDFYDRLAEQKEMLAYYTGEDLEEWQQNANDAYNIYYEYLHRYLLAYGEMETVWNSLLSMERFGGIKETFQQWADAGTVTADSLQSLYNNNADFKEFVDYMQELGMFSWDSQENITGLVNQINALSTASQQVPSVLSMSFLEILQDVSDEFDALNDALESIEENGIVGASAIEKLLDEYEGLEKYFKKTANGYVLGDEYADMSTLEVLQDYVKNYVQTYRDALAECTEGTTAYTTAQENLNNAIAVGATLLRTYELEEYTEKLEKQKDALDDQKDAYKDLIDIRKDLLESYQEEVNYQKELAAKQKNVADLQTKLAVARLDTSASGMARVRELEEELQTAQDELDEYTLERAINDLTKELDDSYSEYEKFIDKEVTRLEEAINNAPHTFKLDVDLGTDSKKPTTTTSTSNTSSGGGGGGGFSGIGGGGSSRFVKTFAMYHSGGLVGDIASLKSNEQFAKLLKGEFVSTPAQMDRFINQTLPQIANSGNAVTIQYNSPLVSIECGQVTNDTLPKLNELVDAAAKKIEQSMVSALSRSGYRQR